MNFYVAGPYQDRPGDPPGSIEENYQIARLREHYPDDQFLSPYDVPVPHENPTHAQNLHADCQALLACDAIVLRPGWSTSKGAMIELNLATGTGTPVYVYVAGWLLDPEGETYNPDDNPTPSI